jgi:hypothetical protein
MTTHCPFGSVAVYSQMPRFLCAFFDLQRKHRANHACPLPVVSDPERRRIGHILAARDDRVWRSVQPNLQNATQDVTSPPSATRMKSERRTRRKPKNSTRENTTRFDEHFEARSNRSKKPLGEDALPIAGNTTRDMEAKRLTNQRKHCFGGAKDVGKASRKNIAIQTEVGL